MGRVICATSRVHIMVFTKFLYHLRIISWNQFHSNLFTKEVVFTEIFQKIVIQKFRNIHSLESQTQCEKWHILSHQKIFRQLFSNLLISYNRYFHRIFVKSVWEKILVVSTLWELYFGNYGNLLSRKKFFKWKFY